MVTAELGLLKVTGAGPLTSLHEMVSGPPPPLADPFRVTVFVGRVMLWLAPALTATGTGFTATPVVALTVTVPSVAVSLSTYDPNVEKVACVTAEFGLLNVTVPGPLTLLQVSVKGPLPPLAEPFRVTVLVGSVIVWLGPALTVRGGVGPGFTATPAVALTVVVPSVALNCRT